MRAKQAKKAVHCLYMNFARSWINFVEQPSLPAGEYFRKVQFVYYVKKNVPSLFEYHVCILADFNPSFSDNILVLKERQKALTHAFSCFWNASCAVYATLGSKRP